MPPHISRKRQHTSPANEHQAQTSASATKQHTKDAVHATARTKGRSGPSLEENKAFLKQQQEDVSSSGEEGSDEEMDSDEFEDVGPQPASKKRKVEHKKAPKKEESPEDDSGSEEEMDWEDATKRTEADEEDQAGIGDLELTLDSVPTHTIGSAYGTKKGPSKIERQIRTNTHCMHVQALMYHNLIRNSWACDKEAQKSLLNLVPKGVTQEVERWRKACGDALENYNGGRKQDRDGATDDAKPKTKKYSKKHKNQRDWGNTADEQERGVPNLSQGDPTVRLLNAVRTFWKKRFHITAPGIRKQGWKDASMLEQEVKSMRNDFHDPEEHGEQIKSRMGFRELAQKCQGSRDVGAQLFVALLRGLGLEARLVASLQPIGFGWSKGEDADPAKKKKAKQTTATTPTKGSVKDSSDVEMLDSPPAKKKSTKPAAKPKTAAKKPKPRESGGKSMPIDLSDGSDLSDPPESDTDDSILDITPPTPTTSIQKYDRDLAFPHYWAEVLSPTSQTWIPVDPLVLGIVAAKDDEMAQFEPRGGKAEKAKQVLAYVVGFNTDNTAKDVTVRYLKRHMLPGKTKGARMPIEKVPIYNRKGKVVRTTQYDWFKHVMKIYERPDTKRTAADDLEDNRELMPVKHERKAKEGGEDTLQGLKTSAEFVLERHLRREEAIRSGAQSVRTFTAGKGDKAKEEPVFKRCDILVGKTVETWHKEGREVKEGEQPIKEVPFRAVTTIRKRELEEAERASGEKMKQGLYEKAQTRYIIPPPIGPDRAIPKNAYGNMDVYVPSMVPKGAVHLRLKGSAKLCRKMGFDYAEACTGFEFGHRMAVPILTGVVVAEENSQMVREAWETEQAQKAEKERIKREKLALGMWKKFANGLRIVERVKRQYGDHAGDHFDEALSHLPGKKGKKASGKKKEKGEEVQGNEVPEDTSMGQNDEGGGGFLPEGMDVEILDRKKNDPGDDNGEDGGGFCMDGQDDHAEPLPDPWPSGNGPVDTLITSDLSDVPDAVGSETRTPSKPIKKTPGKLKPQPAPKSKKTKAVVPPDDDAHDSDPEHISKPKKRAGRPKSNTQAEPKRRASGRGAARKSAEAVKSHYFEGSEEDVEDD